VTGLLIATLDGKLHPADLPLLRADELGALRGDGVFETTLAVDGVPRDLDEHLARLATSAKMLDIDLPDGLQWHPGIDAVLAAWRTAGGAPEMVLRLLGTRGPESTGAPTCWVMGSTVAKETRRQRAGARIRTLARGFTGSEVERMPWLLPGAKTLSYAVNMAAVRHAKSLGDDDVVFIGSDDTVLEGPTATVVLADGDSLVTPPRDGVLDGITVRRLFGAAEAAGWQTSYTTVTPDRLLSAEGAYLLSSVRLLTPIVAVDGTARPVGPRTRELAQLLGVQRDDEAVPSATDA
jgi:4-amino-4-deoxychorismate lyase